MPTRAKLGNHPIHPALVAFPIVYYTTTVIALVAHAISNDPFWFRVGMTASIAGVVMAVVAAIPGAIDLLAGVPRASRARKTGMKHAAYNIAALILFGVTAGLLWDGWYDTDVVLGRAPLESTAPMLISIVGLAATMVAGSLGWKLVQTHHVGIEPGPDLRPRRPMIDPDLRPGAVGRTASQVRPSLH